MPAQDVLVIGLGYVGLPLAIQAARSGFQVTGLDTSEKIVAGLMAGRSHVDDVTDAEIAEMLGHGFRATTDETAVEPQDVIVICVPTPLSEADGPDLSAVRAATATAGRLLTAGTLVSLESTTYPGTTEEVVAPAAGEGLRADRRDRFLARVLAGADRPGQPGLRLRQHAQDRRRPDPVLHGRGRGVLLPDLRPGGPGQVGPRGGDGQAAGEHLPAREHRPGQRDG